MKPKTLVLPPQSRLDEVCSAECRRLLEQHFDTVWNDTGRDYSNTELAEMISDAEVILTSWGSPNLDVETLQKATKLKMIGHAAGTLKGRIPIECFDKGIKLFNAAPRIAQSVGEFCMAVLLASLRRIPALHTEMQKGNWKGNNLSLMRRGHELSNQTVGIVSASSTARAFIRFLTPFQVNILVYDPYLTEDAAAKLNVRKATLEEVMCCPIISVHAPKLESTYGMLNKQLLALIPDHAIFINTSRPDVLDEEALIAELQKNRFFAAIDVFSMEPLPEDSPFLKMNNVILTPHAAGGTHQGNSSLMQVVVEDMLRSKNHEPTVYEVKQHMFASMA